MKKDLVNRQSPEAVQPMEDRSGLPSQKGNVRGGFLGLGEPSKKKKSTKVSRNHGGAGSDRR